MSTPVIIFLVAAVVLLLIGADVASALGLSSILFFLMKGLPTMTIVQRMFAGIDIVALMCIPFFILAGDLMAKGGIAKRLVNLCNMVIGNVTGGLAFVTMVVCAVFAAMTGSAMACCVTIGAIMLPYMLQAGYSRDYSTATICAGAVLGPIIPPSTAMVIYAVNANVSLTDLYLMGVPAGIILLIAMCIVSYFMCRKRGYRGLGRAATTSDGQKLTAKEVFKAILGAIPALGSPLIILGSIYAGIATPTESAVVAVLYSFIVGVFIYREIKLKDIPALLKKSAVGTAKVMYIVAAASLFGWVISYAGIPKLVVNGLLGLSTNPNVILLLILVILLIMGCFMEATPIMLITIPMFLPVITQLGLSPLHFGIVMCVAVCIGFVTPPFGTVLFTGMQFSGESMQKIAKNLVPLLITMLVVLLLITFVPQLTMFIVK